MGRNILIFSDGTGQAGGLFVDERRSNVYKLYRATRCGPESSVDPALQLAFYDAGLGSGGSVSLGLWRRIYNLLSQMTGLGITRNIIDCYAAIIRIWQPGDRIYLFGFSRGAYTVRCLAGALGLCGVPTCMRDGTPLRRDAETARELATEAVAVYQFGNGVRDRDSGDPSWKDPLRPERLDRARAFRDRHGCEGDGDASNASPYLIGVWDTVAALGLPLRGPALWLAVAFAAALVAGAIGAAAYTLDVTLASLFGLQGSRWRYGIVLALCLLAALAPVIRTYVYWPVPGGPHKRGFRFATLFRMTFYNHELGRQVRFARHALAIDEARKDFARVPWVHQDREARADDRLKQIWFAGSHSDVGGSYEENESRLSDVALAWMVAEAQALPDPIHLDRRALNLFPSPEGPQHDEVRSGPTQLPRWLRGLVGWSMKPREIPTDAVLHEGVFARFKASAVLIHDRFLPYRPTNLRQHDKLGDFYDQPPPAGPDRA